MPDYWGLGQQFPVMPLDKLNEPAIRSASLWDITCDSDGEIAFNPDAPLYLHDIDLDSEEYFLAFFNVGAYQETLGMHHNLFSHPNECTIFINEESYTVEHIVESEPLLDVLGTLGYDKKKILNELKRNLANTSFITEKEKSDRLAQLKLFLHQNGYLRTTM